MASNSTVTISQLRCEQYAHHNSIDFPEVHQFYKSPYSWLKARFYMEISAILVFLLLKTKLNPNTITITYGLSAVLGGVLIASGEFLFVIIGVGIFFMRGVLDWADGHYARKIGKTSLTGHILDVYGAVLGSVCLGVGLGLFVESRSESVLVYYLVILYPLSRALLLTNYSQSIMFKQILVMNYAGYRVQGKFNILKLEKNRKADVQSSLLYNIVYKFLDDRARTVDFIGLIIIIDLYFETNYTFILFIVLVVKWVVAYVGSFYVVARGGWVEAKHDSLIKNVLVDD
jgi:phosphatidylglycerophosphate synthase